MTAVFCDNRMYKYEKDGVCSKESITIRDNECISYDHVVLGKLLEENYED